MVISWGADVPPGMLHGLAAPGTRLVFVASRAEWVSARHSFGQAELHWLELDVLKAAHRRAVAQHWENEPLNLVLHLQAMAHSARPLDVRRSIVDMTQAVSCGLRAARGHCVYILPDYEKDALSGSEMSSYLLGPALQRAFRSSQIPVSGVQLPRRRASARAPQALLRFLTHAM
ncbi:MAG: hypothetical protein AAF484_00805 [Pseudomonadota bacterium]